MNSSENIRVKSIWQESPRELGILWTNDTKIIYDVVELRKKCPCALCIDEWTRKPKLRPEDIGQDIRPVVIESVGRYALSIAFSDGHKTGIYTFKSLKDWTKSESLA